ncbi:hypothetical protein Q4557_00620 [Shewanella sp. 5_MG-2023]|uniref:hypothetical protein n=1 Tax=Shewanella sp. 5_MG-2023 TaxID=3062656 RepID=UPI0026E42D5D|nr:hypothetical protein [Shewanella sp. 5_MG-2023]MDO6638464.1 hypothetical protein [Shewanella sp. 5_MG-2023]
MPQPRLSTADIVIASAIVTCICNTDCAVMAYLCYRCIISGVINIRRTAALSLIHFD